MPGYKPLPNTMTGPAADQVRQADTRRLDGDPAAAAVLLEEALGASLRLRSEMPGWLCGRLAAIYRSLGRYDDEVHLLECYRDTQLSEDARTRYDARLSKARTIAERKRPRDSGALRSIRDSLGRPARGSRAAVVAKVHPVISQCVRERLQTAVAAGGWEDGSLSGALSALCDEATEKSVPVEGMVGELRIAFDRRPGSEEGRAEYSNALVRLLSLHFDEA